MNSDNQKKKDDQPWNQTFNEGRDENGNLSRMQMRKENKSHNLLTVGLIVIIGLIALASIVYGLSRQTALGQNESKASSSVQSSSVVSSKKKIEQFQS